MPFAAKDSPLVNSGSTALLDNRAGVTLRPSLSPAPSDHGNDSRLRQDPNSLHTRAPSRLSLSRHCRRALECFRGSALPVRALTPWLLLAACAEERLVVGTGKPVNGGSAGAESGSGASGGAPDAHPETVGGTAGGAGEGDSSPTLTGSSGGNDRLGTGGSDPEPAGGTGSGGSGGAMTLDGGDGGTGGGVVPVIPCGNGSLDAGESCDDGNLAPDDGCDAACAVEPGWRCDDKPDATCNRSCVGMTGTECNGDDCCASPLLPRGTYQRRATVTFSATVSSFRLDKYEVTVGRMRAFAKAWRAWQAAGNPAPGAGAHPKIPGSGWDEDWSYNLNPASGDVDTWCVLTQPDAAFNTWTLEIGRASCRERV